MLQTSVLHYPLEDHPAPGAIVEVAPGVRWIRMPLPFALDHINLWLLEDGDGTTLVDTGIGLNAVTQAWQELLDGPCRQRPLRRIFVTHCHPDHLGLAQWLMTKLDIPLMITQGEMLMAHAWWQQLPGYSIASMLEQFRRHGLAQGKLDELANLGPGYAKRVPGLPAEYRRVLDGERIAIDGRDWRVIVGYGHSPEHASLYCEELNVLISGDMVLPRISTNVSVMAATPHDDPLKLYLDSLARLKELPRDVLVLPSHGMPFRGLHTRIAQLQAHHAERCAELLAACAKPHSAAELVPLLFRRVLDTHQIMFAMGEAVAHLNHLEHAHKVRKVEGGDNITRYVVAR